MERADIQIYNQDCLEVMKLMKDKEFDLAIVDPPYGININMNIGRRKHDLKKHKVKKWDIKPSLEYFQELKRVSKYQIIWGANNFTLEPSNGWIVWDKDISGDVDFSQAELAYTNIKNNIKIFKLRAQSSENYSIKIHPTQKPVALYKWLLNIYAKKGDKILDTHLGSGSIAVACWDLKFDLTAYEIDKEYYDNAVKRLEEHKKQLFLF